MRPVQVAQDGVRLPLLRNLWTDETCYDHDAQRPVWNTVEVAETFFGRNRHWLKWHLQQRHDQMHGVSIVNRRSDRGFRIWWLVDIEQLAHGLFAIGAVEFEQLQRTVHIVKLIAQSYGFVPYTRLDATALDAIAESDRRGEAEQAIPIPEPPYRPPSTSTSARIRAWARQNGYRVGQRGYLPREVVEAYERAHP